MWGPGEIQFEFVPELTEGSVVTLEITTPAGRLLFMAEASQSENGKTLFLQRAHIQSDDVGPNNVGAGNMRALAVVAMELMGYDEIVIEGAVRTTGANPGRTPKPLRFTSRDRHSAGS